MTRTTAEHLDLIQAATEPSSPLRSISIAMHQRANQLLTDPQALADLRAGRSRNASAGRRADNVRKETGRGR